MSISRKLVLAAAAIACSACAGALPSAAQADPGNGNGLVPLGTFTCTSPAGGTYSMTFVVPGAQNAANPGTGAANAPFPGFLVSYTQLSGAPAPLPTGTWQLLAFPTGRTIGQKPAFRATHSSIAASPPPASH